MFKHLFLAGAVLYLAAADVMASQIKVACVGDSITQCTYLTTADSYPYKLGNLLGTNYTVVNYGVSGTTLLKKGDSPYWVTKQFTNSHTTKPDIVTIMLGTNDSKPQNQRYNTNFESDYEELIASYTNLDSHPLVFLVTPIPVRYDGLAGINNGVMATNIVPAVSNLAVRLGVGLINLYLPLSTNHADWFYDNVHPSARGFTVIAGCIYTALQGGYPDGEMPLPLLTRDATATHTTLSWPAQWGGLVPEFTTRLWTNTIWYVETDPIILKGTTVCTTNYSSSNYRFYRFRKP